MVKKITPYNVLEPFLVKPFERIHLAEISRLISQPHPTVRQWLNIMEKNGVLKKENRGRLTLFSLNFQSPNIIDYLVISEKNKLIKKCGKWLVLGEISSYINRNLGEGIKVLIFGSASEAFNAANDIDMLVIGKDKNFNALENLTKRFNKKPHIIQADTLKKVSAALRIEIISKHLLIKGSEDFLMWMLWSQLNGAGNRIKV